MVDRGMASPARLRDFSNLLLDKTMGQRVSPEVELEGLDIPEIGAVAYPEFVLAYEKRPAAAL